MALNTAIVQAVIDKIAIIDIILMVALPLITIHALPNPAHLPMGAAGR